MRWYDRRDFLMSSAGAAAALAAAADLLRGTPAAADQPKPTGKGDPTERLRVAVVGVKGRGMSHVGGFAGRQNCVITTICDCDEAVAGKAIAAAEKAQGFAPKFER